MKRSFVVVAVLTLGFTGITVSASAQEEKGYRISAVSFGAGESPISGGIAASVNLTTEKGRFAQIMAQSEQAWFMWGQDWKTAHAKCSLYGSIGHFQGAPWVGPYVGCTRTLAVLGGQEVSIGALTWPGVYIGREPKNWRNDGVKNPEAVPAGFFTLASASIGGLSVSIAHLNFLDDPTNWLPGVGYSRLVQERLELNSSVTWNTNARAPMFFIGGTYRPAK